MVHAVLISILLATAAVWAAPGDPFGGDDTGFIPPDAATQKCEAAIGKTVAKHVSCVEKCHAARAKTKLTTSDAEEGCESVCEGKYDIAIGKLTKAGPLGWRGAMMAACSPRPTRMRPVFLPSRARDVEHDTEVA
jgi:hypothetical protein